MFTKVDSFYSFPLTGIIPLEFKLLKSSSLGYLKGSSPPAEHGVSVADPGCMGTHAVLKWGGVSSGSPRGCSSGFGLGSGLSLPLAPLLLPPSILYQSAPRATWKKERERLEDVLCGEMGWEWKKRILKCHLQPGRAGAMPQSAHPRAGTVLF